MIPSRESSGIGDDEAATTTELPGLRTWRGVYLFVVGSFILWTALLVALTWTYNRPLP